jgi:hypothetical protein
MQKQLCSVEDYERFTGPVVVDRILQKAKAFQGFRVANFNSTGYGGGVAELLTGMTLLMNSTGIKAEWRVPLVVQVSRFDRWKDPKGVVEAFKIARKEVDATLVLLGNFVTDDPEGAKVYEQLTSMREERILNEAGFSEDSIGVLSGRQDAHKLNAASGKHGWLAQLAHIGPSVSDLDAHLRNYIRALQSNRTVIAVVGDDGNKRREIANLVG